VGSADSNSFTLDTYDPTGSITAPTNGGYYDETFTNMTGTASDSLSGVASVSITIYNSTGGKYWSGTAWQDGSSDITANGTTSWYFSDTGEFPTFTNGSTYIVNLTVNDSASNSNTSADSNTFYYDTGGPAISNVLIKDVTINNNTYVKDSDTVNITATVTDANLESGDTAYITANLSGFGLNSSVYADGYNGTQAYWNKSSVTCTPSDGTITVTINASDKAGNYATEANDTITADNTAPSFSYAVMDADNDGTNNSYVDVYFSETTMNTSSIASTDFNISDSNVSVAAVQNASGSRVTLQFNTTFQTGASPNVGIAGSVADLAGNTFTSGTVTINTYRINLRSGWNLISLPADASNALISTVVTDIVSNLAIIWTYNASADSWTSWTNGDGDTFRLNPGTGYWINMNTADTLIGNYNLFPTGPTSPPEVTIYAQSWNLIGHWATYNQTAGFGTYGALRSLSDSDVGTLVRWTGTGYTPVLGQTMSPGDGFWLSYKGTSNTQYWPNCAS
jgi:hypothetical protein